MWHYINIDAMTGPMARKFVSPYGLNTKPDYQWREKIISIIGQGLLYRWKEHSANFFFNWEGMWHAILKFEDFSRKTVLKLVFCFLTLSVLSIYIVFHV